MTTVNCAATKGDLPIEIVWMFDGRPITNDRTDMTVSNTGRRVKQLAIESVTANHTGEYTCVASNLAGSTSRSATLNVNGTNRETNAWNSISSFLNLILFFHFFIWDSNWR